MQQFLDKVALSGVKTTQEGYLIADAFAVRTGIQRYAGYEVGRPDMVFVDVYRPEDEVFALDSLQSFSHVPVTNNHPSVPVTSDNWKDLAVGEASSEVLRDGERLRIPLILKDKSAVDAVRDGKRELSAGYSCDLVWEDGVTPQGQTYQAVQRDIRANHIAIVKNGRAGHEFRIGDSEPTSWGAVPINDKESPMSNLLRTILVDGISIQVTDQGAEAITKLQGQLRDSAAQIETLRTDHAAQITAKDTEIGALKVKLADAEKKVPSGATLDALVASRSALIADAKKIAKDIKVEGLSDAEIRKAAVVAKYGEDVVKDASDDMIAGMFKAATTDSASPGATDPVHQALRTADVRTPLADNGQAAYEKRLTDAWKGTAAA